MRVWGGLVAVLLSSLPLPPFFGLKYFCLLKKKTDEFSLQSSNEKSEFFP